MVTMATPKIFISYSHDSEEHKLWVGSLADEIRAQGVTRGCQPEIIVDQDLNFGDNIFQFIYYGISSLSDPSDAILFICTPQYKLKADEYLNSSDLGLVELRNNVLKAYTWFLKNEIKLDCNLKNAFSSLIDDGIGKKRGAGQTNDILNVYSWFLEKGVRHQDSIERAFLKLIQGGVQRENVMISVFLRYIQEDTTLLNTRRIPVLREGAPETSIPEDLEAQWGADLRKGEDPGDKNRQKLCEQLLDGGYLDESGDKEFIRFQDPDPDVGVEGFIKVLPKKAWEFHYGGVTRAQDVCGAWIDKAAYGQRGSNYGWEIDHIIPRSRGGTNAIANLRPLHWKNNDAKGDNLDGHWACAL